MARKTNNEANNKITINKRKTKVNPFNGTDFLKSLTEHISREREQVGEYSWPLHSTLQHTPNYLVI